MWLVHLSHQISAFYEFWNLQKKLVTHRRTDAHTLHYNIDNKRILMRMYYRYLKLDRIVVGMYYRYHRYKKLERIVVGMYYRYYRYNKLERTVVGMYCRYYRYKKLDRIVMGTY